MSRPIFRVGFRYSVLLVFVLLEVLLFDADGALQAAITTLEYLFVLLALVANRGAGIAYLVSFTLLAMGEWSHTVPGTVSNNFLGMRLFGFSVNVLFSFGVLIFLVAGSQTYRTGPPGRDSRFFNYFILYSAFVGLVSLLVSANHLDNFLADLLSYLPYYASIYFVSILSADHVTRIFKYGMSVTVISMLFSFATDIRFEYGAGFYFVLMNGFAFVAVFAVFFCRRFYSPAHYGFLAFSVVFLLATGTVFIGGKTIVIAALTLIWYASKSRTALGVVLLSLTAVVIFLDPILSFALDRIAPDAVLLYKFTQILEVFAYMDIETLASTSSSMGNLFAEGMTTARYLIDNKLLLIFGKGFGGGIPDLFGYLSPLARPGFGYAPQDALRDDFFRMHLPIFEIVIKSGIVGLTLYVIVLYRSLTDRHIFAFIYFVLMLTVFYVSKEMLLLTLLFMKLSMHFSSGSRLSVQAQPARSVSSHYLFD